MLMDKKVAVIGVGKIGESLISGLINAGKLSKNNLTGTVRHSESLSRVLSRQPGLHVTLNNKEAVAGKDIIILAVKPQAMGHALEDIADELLEDQLIISIAASVTTAYIEERLPKKNPVIRVMPNTPCLLNEGMSVLCRGRCAGDEHLALACEIFQAVGKTAVLDESLMDGVTGLSGSGPAYLYMVIESLAEAGVKVGIPREVSTTLAAQTMLGSAKMVLELKEHPALLKDMVTTPAGCTIDGILELEEGKLRVTLIKAVIKATERARELVRERMNG